MKISFLKIALAVSLIFNLTVLGAAGYFYYAKSTFWVSPFGARTPKDKFLFEELSLRPDQIKKMREKAMQFRVEIVKKRQEIAERRGRLLRLMRADAPDEHAIKSAIAEISGIQAKMEEMVATHILRMKAILDKDQQKKFIDLIENAMSKGRQPGCPPIAPN
jgi:Spy/CpxP family protein refolding chaperone